jgi:hypothetical protein
VKEDDLGEQYIEYVIEVNDNDKNKNLINKKIHDILYLYNHLNF